MGMFSDVLAKVGLGSAGPFGHAGGKSVVGIDIGAGAIKVVQLRKEHGKIILETYGALGLGPYANEPVGTATRLSVDSVTTALTDVLREAHVTATRAGVCVPYSASLATVITMPKMSEEELQRAIPLEARKSVHGQIYRVTLPQSMRRQNILHKAPLHEKDRHNSSRGENFATACSARYNEARATGQR
jgi:hypothetical protein